MLVLIDESGCPGFKISKGSDPVFGVGMVIFKNGEHARETEANIKALHTRLRHRSEFKFSKCDDDKRDGFFQAIAACPFSVRALIAKKEYIYSQRLRGDSEAFYSYFVKMLMAHDNGTLREAKVRIDGSGDREFRRALGGYLRRELGRDRIKDVKMTDSKDDELMQLADMCIGAITRAERVRGDPTRWRDMLRGRIDDVWHYG